MTSDPEPYVSSEKLVPTALLLSSALTPRQRETLCQNINEIVSAMGFRRNVKTTLDTNAAAFRATLQAMLKEVQSDLQLFYIQLGEELARCAGEQHLAFLTSMETFVQQIVTSNQRMQGRLKAIEELKEYEETLRKQDEERRRQLDEQHRDFRKRVLDKALEEHSQLLLDLRRQIVENVGTEHLAKVEAIAKENQRLREVLLQAHREVSDIGLFSYHRAKTRLLEVIGRALNEL